ncbi:MAG: cupin domain-containing protein [Xanthomonadales bacterium]|nr:cupin domain-containing protein [Xanthomonadales bacterium]
MAENGILKAATIDKLPEKRFVHPFNAKAIRHTRSLGDLAGLSTLGLHLVRIEPGDETTQHHNHEYSDEFVYILSGSCTLYLDDDEHPLAAGDFVGFPARGAYHSMKNTGDDDLVYLMGGGRPEVDVGNYPRIKRRIYILSGQRESVETRHLEPLAK